jgi:membrane fusion protein (multidrug efflux system)
VLRPQQAVTRASSGDPVMVVGADGKVAQRSVKLGGNQGASWVVLEGLKAGEQVMVDGFQKLRPGITVKPVPASGMAGAPAAPTAPVTGTQPAAPAASAAASARS